MVRETEQIAVVVLGQHIGRVQVEDGTLAVVGPEESLIAHVLHHHILEPLRDGVDQGESCPGGPWACPKGCTPAAVALPDELVEVPRPKDRVLVVATGKPSLNSVEILPGVEDVPKGCLQLLGVIADHAEEVDKVGVEVIVKFFGGTLLVQQDGGPAAEHLHIGSLPLTLRHFAAQVAEFCCAKLLQPKPHSRIAGSS